METKGGLSTEEREMAKHPELGGDLGRKVGYKKGPKKSSNARQRNGPRGGGGVG